MEKHCKKCDRTLPIDNFHNDKNSKDGKAFYCKDCISEYGRKYRDTPEGIYANIKSRSNYYKRTGSKFYKPLNMSQDDFVSWYVNEEKQCHYCDIPEDKLWIIQEDFDRRVSRLEVDCMDNSVGYEEGNIVLACHLCNFIKLHVLTSDEMYYVGQNFIKPKWEARLNG